MKMKLVGRVTFSRRDRSLKTVYISCINSLFDTDLVYINVGVDKAVLDSRDTILDAR